MSRLAAVVQEERAPHPTCPVLHPATRRKLLDGNPLSSDSPAHRTTRAAPHVIESPTSGAGAMSSGGRGSGGVSEQDSRSDHAHEHAAADGTCPPRMTFVNVSQRMHELSDGMIKNPCQTRKSSVSPARVSMRGTRMTSACVLIILAHSSSIAPFIYALF